MSWQQRPGRAAFSFAGAAVTWLISTRVSPGKIGRLCRSRQSRTHRQRTPTGLYGLGVADLSEADDESQQLAAGHLAFNYSVPRVEAHAAGRAGMYAREAEQGLLIAW